MRRLILAFVLSVFALLPIGLVHAARDGKAPAARATPYELVVFETDGCVYCEMFRRDLLPLYSSSPTAKEAPIRFVNLTWADESGMGLSGAITIAPTIVLLRDGQEVDRIVGLTGPEDFMTLVHAMLGRGN